MAVHYNEDDALGGMVLTEYGDDIDGRLVLPETVDGKPLVAIGERVFQNRAGLEEVVIPDSVKMIGKNAFLDCRDLRKVVLSENLEVIKMLAFCVCPLEECRLPDSLREIQAGGFGASGLKEVTIPAGCSRLGKSVFSECGELRAITVEEENPSYASFDGVLYNKDGTCLIQYPQGREESVYRVRAGTEEIGKEAFETNDKLRLLALPLSLRRMQPDAFDVCRHLRYIEYSGSRNQWERIEGANWALEHSNDVEMKFLYAD